LSLRVRPMVAGDDDAVYVDIYNRVAAGLPEQSPTSPAELEFQRSMPYYDPHGRFVAELAGCAVGLGFGTINPLDPARIGWLNVKVLPELRRRRVGTGLAEAALASLRQRGAQKLWSGAWEESSAGTAFLRSLGFREQTFESWLRRPLADLPHGIGEHTGVEIRETTLEDDDLRLTVDLLNEVFCEDRDRTPTTVEARRKRAAELARQGGVIRTWVAMLGGRPVGVVQAVISPRENSALDVRRGTLMGLGVLRSFRRQGIARALVIRALEFLKDRGMAEAELSADNDNPTRALGIYLKMGFRVARRFVEFELPRSHQRDVVQQSP